MRTNLPLETELVLMLCRTPIGDDIRERILAIVARGVDWNAVLRHASGWEMEAVVCSNLRVEFGEAIPPDALRSAAERERQSRAHSLARTLVTVDLVAKLERHGIETLVLKGPAVGVAAYKDPSLRSFSDIDLLVRRKDLAAARELLLALAYRREYASAHEKSLIDDQHALEFSDSRNRIELHWTLLERYLRLDVSEAELWDRAVTVPCAGGSIRVLGPEHLFLFLAAHGAKHEWERLRWICDVAQLLARLTPHTVDAILDLAAESHSKRLLALALRLSRDVLGAALPSTMEGRLVPESDTRLLVDKVVERIRRNAVGVALKPDFFSRVHPALTPLIFWARSRERLIDRVGSVARVLFVPTMADEGPALLRWTRRPLRLASRVLRGPSTV